MAQHEEFIVGRIRAIRWLLRPLEPSCRIPHNHREKFHFLHKSYRQINLQITELPNPISTFGGLIMAARGVGNAKEQLEQKLHRRRSRKIDPYPVVKATRPGSLARGVGHLPDRGDRDRCRAHDQQFP
jgi:hypothetical protein